MTKLVVALCVNRKLWAKSYFLALLAQKKRNPLGFVPPGLRKVALQLDCCDESARRVVSELVHEGSISRVVTSGGRVVYIPKEV